MGLLKIFSKPDAAVLPLPTGSMTVDRCGTVVVRTMHSSFPDTLVKEVAGKVFNTFREAASLQLPLSELTIYYPSLKITARELRGGAIVYFFPKVPVTHSPPNPSTTTRS